VWDKNYGKKGKGLFYWGLIVQRVLAFWLLMNKLLLFSGQTAVRKISSKSIHKFLSNPLISIADRQMGRKTDTGAHAFN